MDRKLQGRMSYMLMASVLIAIILGGCRTRVEPETPDYVEYGWELMAEENYRAAIVQFVAGTEIDVEYADGWNGLGWAYAKLGVPDTSASNFTEGVDLADTTIVGTEVLAGRSFARLALRQFSGAVSDARAALLLTPDWEFRRDATITYEDLILTAAAGFYSLAQFDSSLVWVRKLDNTFATDITTLAGKYRLAAKLEALEEDLR